ncbi:hypothetical protein Q673_15415 [Marinobacter sp. EN3]|jgi:DNA sulfur modification protein DndE|uniref:DNA sulfur modification protein DndE n=1 Tax=Marinobacter sp. EN3 TaxID=1397533 RepID=UPI0003B920BE|nr:DNA sulfur modification protein DndE [Marinobacter sp. EN3]ERS10106.1 hypothetical protein Q673_15415 [Marinobacter sp. EN3]|tara:strand:+ start:888 stop:1256 length:369 start_codon:yes stop_codon:yes gene_type:complete
MIDRIRLTATAKNQLITLKRKTGLQHYNSFCRHALCLSLANSSEIPPENLNFSGGLEIDWSTISGDTSSVLINLIYTAHKEQVISEEQLKTEITQHIHRGLSYLYNMSADEIIKKLERPLTH